MTTPLEVAAAWPHMNLAEAVVIFGLPILSLALSVLVFGYLWSPTEQKKGESILPITKNAKYETIPDGPDADGPSMGPRRSTIQAGEVAGDYEEDWKNTFDYVFLVIMGAFLGGLIVLTAVFKPSLFVNGEFWLLQLPKLLVMMTVSIAGGLVCRHFCEVDEKGYVITNKGSAFKVNYTRKLQHFAAYMVPLVVKASHDCHCSGPLELAWGDFFTLLGFLVLIKPIRESSSFFMLQFNSLDRPEDRPNTMKWMVAGNILPGLVLVLFFKTLLGATGQGALVFIIVMITGIGDGLAEPVGITLGRHKYKVAGWFSSRKYTRSWEGSMCVFLSGMIFPALQYSSFDSFQQCFAAMVILAPTMAYAEATAPHTMDTPVLMTLSGLILYGIVTLL